MSDLKEKIKVEIFETMAFLYTGKKKNPKIIKVRTLLEHNGNHAEMISAIIADKFELENTPNSQLSDENDNYPYDMPDDIAP